MSRKANPAAVGIFVIMAVALLTAAIIIFGKGELFKDTREWILYFDGSIKGLSPGSPVVFQGVRIGQVKDIRVFIDKEHNILTPVVMEIEPTLMDFENDRYLNQLTRAQMESILMIEYLKEVVGKGGSS